MRRRALLMMLAAFCITIYAQKSAREEIAMNRYLCGSNYLDYDRYPATQALTPAPKGYEPFNMSHYGRHGSRWLIGRHDYTRVAEDNRDR